MVATLRGDEWRLVGRWPGHLRHRDSGRTLLAEHGRLLAPARRDRAESPAIALSFLRVQAMRDRGRPPLVVLAGGPGGAAIAAFETHLFDWVARMSTICDVVTFDQRGCHGALPRLVNPFRVDYDFDAVLTREGYLDAQRA